MKKLVLALFLGAASIAVNPVFAMQDEDLGSGNQKGTYPASLTKIMTPGPTFRVGRQVYESIQNHYDFGYRFWAPPFDPRFDIPPIKPENSQPEEKN